MSEKTRTNPYMAPSAVLDEVEPEETAGPKLASVGSRLAASVIDHVLVAGLPGFAIFYAPYRTNASLDLTNPTSLGLGFSLAIVFAVAVLACNLFLLRMTGQTIGKKLLGIKLVRDDGHSYVSVWRIVGLRFLPVFFASRWIPVVGQAIWGVEALTIFGRDRKCIHDYLADTIVITEDGAEAPERVEEPETQPEIVARDLGEMRADHLVVVATVHGPVEAALAQGWLEESKIPCRLDFAPVTSNDPVLGASRGETKLLVDEEHVDAAIEVLRGALEEAEDAPLEFDWEAEGFGDQDDS